MGRVALLPDYLRLVPPVNVLIRELKLDKLIVQVLEARLVSRDLQSLVVHRRSVEPRFPGMNYHHQTVLVRLPLVRPPPVVLDQLHQKLIQNLFAFV